MAKPKIRDLTVISNSLVTPHMRRVTVGGSELSDFPMDSASTHIKLLFKDTADNGNGIVKRTYTVRAFRPEQGELDIDFVIHSDGGPASDWAEQARIGDTLTVAGPGPKKFINPEAKWFFFLGDMTALPAISGLLEELPAGAAGQAIIIVQDPADQQALVKPEQVKINWVTQEPSEDVISLVDATPRPEAVTASYFVAGETNMILSVKRHLLNQWGVEKRDLYASGYWKLGMDEDQHQKVKRELLA